VTLLSWAEGSAQHFAGKICDMRLYSKAPTPALIQAMFHPLTRFELYQTPARRIFRIPPYGGGGGNRRRRVLIGAAA
jgi:hypothetical protein